MRSIPCPRPVSQSVMFKRKVVKTLNFLPSFFFLLARLNGCLFVHFFACAKKRTKETHPGEIAILAWL